MTVGFDSLIAPALDDLIPHPRKGRALDLGCGSGRSSRLLRDMGFSVLGLDNNPKLVEAAVSAEIGCEKPVSYCVRDFVASQPVRDFNLALMSFVILTMPNAEMVARAIGAAKGALLGGGSLIVADVHPHNRERENEIENASFDEASGYFDNGCQYQSTAMLSRGGTKSFRPNYHYSLETIIEYLLSAGFVLTALREPRSYTNYPTHLVLRATLG